MIGKMIAKRGRKKNNKENHQTTHKVALNWPSFFFFLIRSPFFGEIERTWETMRLYVFDEISILIHFQHGSHWIRINFGIETDQGNRTQLLITFNYFSRSNIDFMVKFKEDQLKCWDSWLFFSLCSISDWRKRFTLYLNFFLFYP